MKTKKLAVFVGLLGLACLVAAVRAEAQRRKALAFEAAMNQTVIAQEIASISGGR